MRAWRALLLVCLLCTLTFAAVPDRVTRAIDASQTVSLARSVHPRAQAQYDRGTIQPDFQLGYVTLMMSPSPSQQKAIDQLLVEQQDPSSRNYHRWLTPEQYADRFGLNQNDLNKITAWLKARGFTVLSVPRGRNSIVVSGMAYQFEDAFQTQIHRYNVNGELHYANSTPLRMPAALSGIVSGVRGLHDFRMKPMSAGKRVHPEYWDSSLQFTFLAPGDIKTIYNIGPLYTGGFEGTGQKLVVVGQTDIYLADINDFRSAFGLSQISGCTTNSSGVLTACNSTNFQYALVHGETETGTPSKCGDLAEADLDIEWSGATARNAKIIYVNSPLVWNSGCTAVTNSNGGVESALADAINSNYAPVISMSYGICEAFATDHEAELQQANLQGITVVNSSGDTSSAGCDNFTNSSTTPANLATEGLAVSYPASSPAVTAVGGTAIPFADTGSPFWNTSNSGTDLGSAAGYVPEQAWNDPSEFAAYCAGPGAGGTFCTHFHITSALTAQSALGLGGGGGGASNCFAETISGVCQAGFPQPAWQTVTIAGQNTRMLPDISLLASPNFTGYIYCTPLSELGGTGSTSSCATGIANALAGCASSTGTCSVVGGTSASAPVFAGMVTLLNQYFHGTSSAGLGNVNPTLYRLAKLSNGSANPAFHQITDSASNNVVYCAGGTPSIQPVALRCPGATGTVGTIGYQASTFDSSNGYNLVTGLGSVDLNQLAHLWVASAPTFTWANTGATSHTVLAGQNTLNYSFVATPTSSATFEDNVTFGCSFAPTDATLVEAACVFTPSSIAAGSAATAVTLTISTKGPNTGTAVALQQRVDERSPWLPLALPIAGVVMAGLAGRKASKHSLAALFVVVLVLVAVMIACGGGSSPVVVTVSPTSASLYPNHAGWPSQTVSFSHSVTNTNNTAVNWTASSGAIDASGNYTAPTIAAGLPSTVTITATSQADSSKSATATVSLKPATVPQNPYTVTVTATEGPTPHSQSVNLVVQ